MSGSNGVQAIFRLSAGVRADDLSHKDYMVAGYRFGLKFALEIGHSISNQYRINHLGGGSFTVEFGKFINVST